MPTVISQPTLDEVGRLVAEACENGDSVSAIAERSNIPRAKVSRIKNGTYDSSPTLETVEAILHAIGMKLSFSVLTTKGGASSTAKRSDR